MSRRRALRVALSGLLLTATATAAGRSFAEPGRRSPHLDRAVAAIDDLDYETARAQLLAALRAGDHRRDDTVLIHRLTGEIAAAFGHPDEATARFRRMLAVDPAAEVAEGQAPKVVEPYDAARAFIAEQGPLAVHLEREPAGDQVQVIVVIDSDPMAMAAGARLYLGDRVARTVRGTERLRLAVPAADRLDAAVVVIDQHGNHLTDLLPAVPAPPPRAAAPPEAQVTLAAPSRAAEARSGWGAPFARWSTWAIAAGVSAGAGAFFGWRASRDWQELDRLIDESAAHDFDEARAVEARGQRNALVSNLSLGAAAACGVVSAVLLIRDRRGHREPARTLSAQPIRGGAAMSMTWELGGW